MDVPPSNRAASGVTRLDPESIQDAVTVSGGLVGARVAAAWSPTRTDCPGARVAAQSAPVQMTRGVRTVQVMPHVWVTALVSGASNETDHRATDDVAVTTISAT